MTKLVACALLFALPRLATAAGVANQANYNDGKPGSPMECRTFEDDPQGTKCARFCQEMKSADREGSTYCMCLPGPCQKPAPR